MIKQLLRSYGLQHVQWPIDHASVELHESITSQNQTLIVWCPIQAIEQKNIAKVHDVRLERFIVILLCKLFREDEKHSFIFKSSFYYEYSRVFAYKSVFDAKMYSSVLSIIVVRNIHLLHYGEENMKTPPPPQNIQISRGQRPREI